MEITKMDKMQYQALSNDRKLDMMFEKMQEMIKMIQFLDRNQLQLFNQERMHRN